MEKRSSIAFAGRWLLISLVVVFALLAFQTIQYSGLIQALAEWQFTNLGEYFPILTIVLVIVIFLIIYLIVHSLLVRRRKNRAGELPDKSEAPAKFSTFAYYLAILSAVFTLSILIQYAFLAGMEGEPANLDLDQSEALQMNDGPVQVTGISVKGPIARSSDDFIFLRRTQFFVPVGSTLAADGTQEFNLFLQVSETDPAKIPARTKGLLRTNSLPPEVAAMYNQAKVPTGKNAAVIFQSERSADRRTFSTLMASIIFTLVVLAFAIWLRRRERKPAAA